MRFACAFIAVLALAPAGCGSSGTGVSVPVVQPAKTYSLSGFQPAAAVSPGRPTTVSFTITQPSGQPLTAYRTCCDPHAGVDLIIVRSDDSHIQYDDSDIGPGGRVTQPVVFPAPGRYRVIVDAYPAHPPQNGSISFQLFTWVKVSGPYRPVRVPRTARRTWSTGTTSRSRATPTYSRSRPCSCASR